MRNVSESLRSLTQNEWMSESSLIFLSESLIRSLFANLFAKNEWFAQKTNEQIPNPAFPLVVAAWNADKKNPGSNLLFILIFFFISNLKDVGSNPENSKSIKFCLHK